MRTLTILALVLVASVGVLAEGPDAFPITKMKAHMSLHLDNGDGLIDFREVPASEVSYYTSGVGVSYDGIRWEGLVPEGACSSLSECADAINETCEDTGNGSGKMAEVDEENNSCAGGCSNEGSPAVSIHCFSTVESVVDECDPVGDEFFVDGKCPKPLRPLVGG